MVLFGIVVVKFSVKDDTRVRWVRAWGDGTTSVLCTPPVP
eukprot:CAMPEP_0198241830 /NCGR_PEP_ID=MMETSP1446-20131203/6526_1 /TAXON_ID=1461542 ORGANISM="Unidentified sp, Strain CCMP2111" /NCGR_SAMPLE_ID=MMETSP1446 /ASSEMBLY_ACC=CAM_ASM_001112 /LENGTH=39 /DNA_ID= /DNA_START= /DNA_END= /DNA_ORIENTATION=